MTCAIHVSDPLRRLRSCSRQQHFWGSQRWQPASYSRVSARSPPEAVFRGNPAIPGLCQSPKPPLSLCGVGVTPTRILKQGYQCSPYSMTVGPPHPFPTMGDSTKRRHPAVRHSSEMPLSVPGSALSYLHLIVIRRPHALSSHPAENTVHRVSHPCAHARPCLPAGSR